MEQEKQAFALPVIRDIVPPAEESVSFPVFPFVMVRSPRLVNASTGSRTISYEGTSALAAQLAEIREAQADDAQAQRTQMQALATKAAGEQAEQRAELLPRATALAQLGRWLREGQEGISQDALDARPEAELLDATQVDLVWDILFQQALLGAQAIRFPEPVAVLKAQEFLKLAQQQGATPELVQNQATAELVLPSTIFALTPLAAAAPSAVAPGPSLTAKYTRLAALQTTLRELQYRQTVKAETARTTPAPSIPVTTGSPSSLDAAQETALLALEQGADIVQAQQAWSEWSTDQEKASYLSGTRGLSATASSVLKSLKLPDKVRFDFALEVLTREATALTTELSQYASGPAPLFRAGGGLWSLEPTSNDAQTSGALSTTTGTPVDPYDAFYDLANNPQAVNRIRPIGIADLNVVEQTLCCYKAGEVAHLENVMQGEYKERSTRRLRRSEITLMEETTHESVMERDTTTTDRFELQKETSRVLQEDQSLSLGATMTAGWGPVSISATANFATATSSLTSDRQTSNYAKTVVDRSLQRVTERVQERRTSILIDEFEENTKHGLDNRNGSKHVVGLYRWIDKVYRMQVVNYGRRLMFEFAVPEPGATHLWAMSKAAATSGVTLVPPRGNPRSTPLLSGGQALDDFSKLDDTNYAAWAAAYGAAVEPPPALYKRVNLNVDVSKQPAEFYIGTSIMTGRVGSLDVPAGYETVASEAMAEFRASDTNNFDEARNQGLYTPDVLVLLAGTGHWFYSNVTHYKIDASGQRTTVKEWGDRGNRGARTRNTTLPRLTGTVNITFQARSTEVALISVTLECQRTTATYQGWQIKTFNAIMAAYQAKQDMYDQALAEATAARGITGIKGTNPAMNRQIERNELKRGCINWLFNGLNFGVYGTYGGSSDDPNPPVYMTKAEVLAQADRAKFVEQCFEWDLLTYTLYPYYWLPKEKWRMRYQLDDTDPLFLNFLQAGLARVIVSVRPGFEKAALHFLRTGQLWNGGDTPGSDSPLYLSVMAELMPAVRTRVGQPWEVRVPTELTVLQAESGAIPGKGLPCDCSPTLALGTVSSPLGK